MNRAQVLCAVSLLGMLAESVGAEVSYLDVDRYIGPGWVDAGYDTGLLTTFRVYAIAPPGTRVFLVGSIDDAASFEAEFGVFHNSPGAGDLPPTELEVLLDPTRQWDTFVTIGLEALPPGVAISEYGFSSQVGGMAGDVTFIDAGWFCSIDAPHTIVGPSGKLLIAQLTAVDCGNVPLVCTPTLMVRDLHISSLSPKGDNQASVHGYSGACSRYGPVCDGDFVRSAIVDSEDLFEFLLAYGSTHPSGDYDGDGHVGFTDLVTLLENWGPCCALKPN